MRDMPHVLYIAGYSATVCQKLDKKRGARQCQHMNHPVPQGHQPPEACNLTHTTLMATLHTHLTRRLYNTHNNFISCMGGVTHPPHNHTHSTSSPPSSRPANSNSASLTDTDSLLITLHTQRSTWDGSKVICHGGHAHLHARTI